MTRVLITGMSGMVGSHLADYLLENTDWDIYGMVRWQSPLDNVTHLLDRVNRGERVFFLEGDLNDMSSLINVCRQAKPDYVFHLAAQSYPKASFDLPMETYRCNMLGTACLLESLRTLALDPWIHVCSSSEVFGRVSQDKMPIDEHCSFHPSSPYAISKIGTDVVARFHAEAYGQKVLTTRMFTHTGPRRGDVFAESSFAKQIAMIEAGHMKAVVSVGNLDSLRTYADVRDAVRAYYMLLTVKPQAGAYYNIGGQHVCRVGEMLDYLLSLSTVQNISIQAEAARMRPLDADMQVADTTKFFKHTGWKAEISFEKTMQDLLDYWRVKVSSQMQLRR
jgi:GDP-mannose 4,6-dehydratase